ncbi:hypothetical protein [Silvibacterium sp.]|uniref:hypothetical protein n=1 Tax=Silvibacterium sp. TaxID=1964179 RepID=UPI0039E694DE
MAKGTLFKYQEIASSGFIGVLAVSLQPMNSGIADTPLPGSFPRMLSEIVR